jgi:hypothetical protein
MPVTTSSLVRLTAAAVMAAVVAVPVLAQNQAPQPPKLKDYEKKELVSVDALLNAAMTTAAPAGAALYTIDPSKKGAEAVVRTGEAEGVTWYNDALRAGDSKTFTPFMLLVDPTLLPSTNVAYGVRVVPKGTTTVAAEKTGDRNYQWDDVTFGELRPAPEGAGKMMQFARAFQAAPGDYDVYVVLRPHSLEKTKDAPVKALLFKQPVTLPNLTTDLTTSSLVVLDKVEQLPAPLPPAQGKEQPWVMGAMKFVPSLDRQFAKTDNFGVYFQVYNETVEAGKPDVTIEYSFYRKTGADEKYFNKTAPQTYNAKTLPPEWSADMGHLVSGGVEIPLASFEPGDYRLEVKITDNLAKKTITRDVTFKVTGA